MTQHGQNSQCNERNNWFINQVACIPNNKLDWVTKGVVLGISQEFIRKKVPHTQLTKMWYPNVADYSGLSIDAIQASVRKLEKAHALVKEVKKEPDPKTKEKKRRIWLAFTPEFLKDPALLFADAEESNHGGSRTRRHKGCDGEIVNYCMKCGEINVPNEDIYYEDAPSEEADETSQNGRALLAELDAKIEQMSNYFEAANIDDDIADQLGGVDKALTTSPSEIARILAIPRHEREGLTDEDLSLIDAITKEMKEKLQ